MHIKSKFQKVREQASQSAGKAIKIALLALLVAGAAAFGFWAGYATKAPDKIKDAALTAAQINPVTKPGQFKKFLQGQASKPRQMLIDIKPKHYARIVQKRNQALSSGYIITQEDSFVPAKIRIDGKTHKVTMRLKGDIVDHLEGDKWSFRIKVRGDDAIWGMKRFSIQDPQRSGWMLEWIMYQWFACEDLIALRYDFVNVILNGKNLGIFALEESFGKELIENCKRREGPILKFDESALFDGTLINNENKTGEADLYYAADIICFQTDKTYRNKNLKKDFLIARAMLNDCRNKKTPFSNVFDVQRAGRTFAILDIISGHHGTRWKNARFYYNPVTSRLELIPYNAYGPYLTNPAAVTNPLRMAYFWWKYPSKNATVIHGWIDMFFSDQEFLKAYFYELNRITAPGYLENFFQAIANDMEKEKTYIYKNGKFDLAQVDQYLKNRDMIHYTLNPKIPARVYAQPEKPGQDHINFLAANTAFLPIRLLGVEDSASGVFYDDIRPRVLDGKEPGLNLISVNIKVAGLSAKDAAQQKVVRANNAMTIKNLRLKYEILGTKTHRWSLIDADPIKIIYDSFGRTRQTSLMLSQCIEKGAITLDKDTKIINIVPGTYTIGADLIFPPGYVVCGGPDTTLNLVNNASIISFSPVRFLGEKKAFFKIVSTDKTGRGFAVINAKGESIIKNFAVTEQNAPKKGAWGLTGAITFYESDVNISNAIFKANKCEDFMNIIRSDFYLDQVGFFESHSDALDIDWGDGVIKNATFDKCGNDCLDCSGGNVKMFSLDVLNAGDKGISVGEKSNVIMENMVIDNANIAIASKDGSFVTAKNLKIRHCKTGLAAYQKKPEYSGGHITAENTLMEEVENPYLLEVGSSIWDNSNMVGPTLKSRQALQTPEVL